MHKLQISSESVKAKTGRSWEEWFSLMDTAGCLELNHKGIVSVLNEKFQVEDWWQQMITVTYEQARGKRLLHERPDGYQISKSRTINAKVEDVFNAWEDPAKREKWLADPEITIRKSTKNRTLRITWVDGATSLDVSFYSKGENVQVSLNHSKLPDTNKAEEMKLFWALQMENLKNFLK